MAAPPDNVQRSLGPRHSSSLDWIENTGSRPSIFSIRSQYWTLL